MHPPRPMPSPVPLFMAFDGKSHPTEASVFQSCVFFHSLSSFTIQLDSLSKYSHSTCSQRTVNFYVACYNVP